MVWCSTLSEPASHAEEAQSIDFDFGSPLSARAQASHPLAAWLPPASHHSV